jgi:hypothetical protein
MLGWAELCSRVCCDVLSCAVMWCCAVLCCAALCCGVLSCACVLCCRVLCCRLLCCRQRGDLPGKAGGGATPERRVYVWSRCISPQARSGAVLCRPTSSPIIHHILVHLGGVYGIRR